MDKVKMALRFLENTDPKAYRELIDLMGQIEKMEGTTRAREHFLDFVVAMWPPFICGRHHKIMAELFDKVIAGKKDRIIINLGPRHGKSELSSWLLPAFFLGKYPDKKIIQCSNTAELAVGFGRKVRNLVATEEYQRVFPGTELRMDSKAAGRWATGAGGEYFAIGVEGTVSGKGADLLIIDDPHALEISTPIPTPRGFIPLVELKIGDSVYGPDGKPTEIIAKSAVLERPLYEVVTDDNQSIFCDGGHLWPYRSDTKLSAKHRISSTRDLEKWDKSSAPCLPRHVAVEYPERDLPIDPWILGAWLGDGTSSLGRMTAHPDDMSYTRGRFEQAGYRTTDQADTYSFGVLKLRAQLIREDLLDNKHIPQDYLIASIEQRMALLQGLMDTDGTVSEAGQCVFSNYNKLLVDGVVELLHSLGVKAKIWKRTVYGNKTDYRVCFRLKDAAMMPRKRKRTRTPTDKRCRSIRVSETGFSGFVQCITVSRKDGLFLAGRGYVVTHNSEQEALAAAGDPGIFNKVYDWYVSGPRQRLQPSGKIIVVQTRWATNDLTGRLLKAQAESGIGSNVDRWEVIELPAVLPSGEPLWPEFWSKAALERTRNSLPVAKWSAQYLQQPTAEIGALIKREWWRRWEGERAPKCDVVMLSGDLAFTKSDRADYSAFTLWGIFEGPWTPPPWQTVTNVKDRPTHQIILLDAWRERAEFPELKRLVHKYYMDKKPDMFILENKVAGTSLIQELRAMGIPVMAYTPTRGTKTAPNDKIVRVNAVADVFASGMVWAPMTYWADQVIEEVASFPQGEHDDWTDTVAQAISRFRQGGFIRLYHDEEEEPIRKIVAAYY